MRLVDGVLPSERARKTEESHRRCKIRLWLELTQDGSQGPLATYPIKSCYIYQLMVCSEIQEKVALICPHSSQDAGQLKSLARAGAGTPGSRQVTSVHYRRGTGDGVGSF